MRRLAAAILIALAAILQVSLLPALRPLGVVPDLTLVVVVLVSLWLATSESLIAAALSGLLLDIASGSNFGLWTGIMTLSALGIGVMHRAGIETDRVFVALVVVTAGTIVTTVVIWVALVPSVNHWPLGVLVGRLIIELVINLILTMVLRPAVRLLLHGSSPQTSSGE